MTPLEYERMILTKMTYYYDSPQKAKEWYNRRHKLLSDYKETPKNLVDLGKGRDVLRWVNLCIGG